MHSWHSRRFGCLTVEISSGELAGTVVSNAVAGALLGYVFAPRGWRALPLPHAANP